MKTEKTKSEAEGLARQSETRIASDKKTDKPNRTSAPAPRTGLPRVEVPNHELIRMVGKGSYGEVWLAKTQVGGFRAVKVVYKGLFNNPRPFEREFEGIKNFEPISRLHPGFLNILHVGMSSTGDYFFYIMELADDMSQGTQIDPASYAPRTLADPDGKARQVAIEEALKFGISIARALDFLHGRKLIHRDVKPSNIVLVNGAAKLADIGLVAEIGRDLSFVGTSGYIPPEGATSPRSDIFSLGKVLYELATGQDRKMFPEFPRGDQPVPPLFLELNEVLLRACHSSPEKRYPSAADMSADLELISAGQSLRRHNLLETRLRRFKRMSAVGVLIALLAMGIFWQIQSARQHKIEIKRQRIGDRIAHASSLASQGEFLPALPVYAEAWELDSLSPENETVHRIRFAATLSATPVLNALERCCSTEILGLCDSGDDAFFFSSSGNNVFKRTENLAPQPLWKGTDPTFQTAFFSRNGGFAATLHVSGKKGGWTRVFDLTTKQMLKEFRHDSRPTAAFFDPDSSLLVTGHENGQIEIWHIGTSNLVRRITAHEKDVLWVEFSPDLSLLASASKDFTAKLWDAKTTEPGKALCVMRHENWVYRAVFHPYKPILVTSSFDRTCRVWNTRTGDELAPALRSDNGIQDLSFSPDGELLVGTGISWKIHLWDASSFQPLAANPVIPLHSRPESVHFVQDGEKIAVGCTDGSLYLWDITLPNIVLPRRVEHAIGRKTQPAVVGEDPSLSKRVAEFQGILGQTFEPLVFAASSSEKWLALADGSKLYIQNADQPKTLPAPIEIAGQITYLFFSRDEKQMAAVVNGPALREGVAHLIDLGTGTLTGHGLRQRDGILDVTWSPDGVRVATGGEDFEAHIWNRATGEHLIGPLLHQNQVMSLSFSRDGRILATLAWKALPRLWDSVDGVPLTPETKSDLKGSKVLFLENNSTLQVYDKLGDEWISEVLRENRPLRDLTTISKLLAGLFDSPAEREHPVAVFDRLRRSYPSQFESPKGQRIAWHQKEQDRLEAAGREKAAAFHRGVVEKLSRKAP